MSFKLSSIIKNKEGFFRDSEIEELKGLRKSQDSFKGKVDKLHRTIFSEEFDYFFDDHLDMKRRSNGENPMSVEYINRIKRKREFFKVSPLDKSGVAIDNSAYELCEEIILHDKNYKEKVLREKQKIKDILYVDLDNVLVDFKSGINKLSEDLKVKFKDNYDEVPNIFSLMEPYEGAVEAFNWMSSHFDVYILSTAPWENPTAWSDKLNWVKKYLGDNAYKRLILTHHKNLLNGQIIIDDRKVRGVDKFQGKHIHFGFNHETGEPNEFPDWKITINYLKGLI